MKLLKSDIRSLGCYAYKEDGNCVIVFYAENCAFCVERILLRNLLQLFGEEYVIVSEEKYWEEDHAEIHVYTNLPWDIYMNATKDND